MTQNSGNPSAAQSPEEGVGRPDDRPGVLRGRATLTLQTRQAQRLVKGRGLSAEKPAIIGLLGFANRVRTLWHGARADDPYADWWLLQVDEALVQAGHELVTLEQAIAKLFEALGAIEVASPVSVKPARIALNFTNPYAFRAAALISQFDALACKVLTARHVGLVGRDGVVVGGVADVARSAGDEERDEGEQRDQARAGAAAAAAGHSRPPEQRPYHAATAVIIADLTALGGEVAPSLRTTVRTWRLRNRGPLFGAVARPAATWRDQDRNVFRCLSLACTLL